MNICSNKNCSKQNCSKQNCSKQNCSKQNPQSLDQFYKDARNSSGAMSICKTCHKAAMLLRYAENPERGRAQARTWVKNNPERKRINGKVWDQSHAVQIAVKEKAWRRANPGKSNAKTARRRAAKLQRTPSWLTDLHHQQIRIFYDAAVDLTKEFGIKMEVDHIVPLQGENVSGLHVPWNLQVITKPENCSKFNKFG